MKTLIWKGIIYNSLEYFKLTKQEGSFMVNANIIGHYEDKIYTLYYHLKIDEHWNVQHLDLEYAVNDVIKRIKGNKIENDWEINGSVKNDFQGIDYIDISLTPFTNTLPINNLNLEMGESTDIKVLYFDILNDAIKPVNQNYSKTKALTFQYKNIPKDFEADLEVDSLGLVVNYPGLFTKVAEI
ncbi:MAG: putative glycolipid-binding domain-containing protein [Sphingobacterium sp.]